MNTQMLMDSASGQKEKGGEEERVGRDVNKPQTF